MSDYLTAEVTLRTGVVERLAPDESNVDDWLLSADYETQIPGGFSTGTVTIPRAFSLEDADRYSNARIEVRDAGGDLHYKGIIIRASQDGETNTRLECVGESMLLEINRAFMWFYVHQRMGDWRGPSVARQLYLTAAGTDVSEGSVVAGPIDGNPAIKVSIEGPWDRGKQCELFLDTPLPIGLFYSAWQKNGVVDHTDGQWGWGMGLGNDDTTMSGEDFDDLRSAGPGTHEIEGDGTQHLARIRMRYGTAAGGDGVEYSIFHTVAALYGTHGLTPIDDPTATLGSPLRASDIIAHAIATGAPDVTLDPLEIEDSGLPVYDCANFQPSTVRALIEELSSRGTKDFEIPDWGCYESYFWRSPGSYGQTWVISREEADEITTDGPDTENRVSGVFVTYRDGAGTTHTVGPPGSDADETFDELADTDLANPGAAFNKNWIAVDAGVTSQTGAVDYGIVKMRDLNRLRWKGSITIVGKIRDAAGNLHANGKVRAGDQLIVEDDPERPPIPIVLTSRGHSADSCKIDAGEPDDGYADVMQAQYLEAAGLVGVS